MGRLYVWVLVMAGCSFRHGAAGEAAGQLDAEASDARAGDARASDARMIDAQPIDACPDADGDGICDAVDDWPCGAKPAGPGATVTDAPSGANLTMTTIDVSTQGQLIVATSKQALALSLHFTLTDGRCQECIDQVEVGWMQGTTGPRSGCAWNGGVPNPGGINTAVTSFAIAAPATAGVYDLRTNIGQNTSCGSGSWWANEVPAASSTIAILCVH
ncbi:MAG: hypothetical protein ACM31C_15560 [Acidobacteriota bacterium]